MNNDILQNSNKERIRILITIANAFDNLKYTIFNISRDLKCDSDKLYKYQQTILNEANHFVDLKKIEIIRNNINNKK